MWKPIEGTTHSINNKGEVRNDITKRILRPKKSDSTYTMCVGDKKVYRSVKGLMRQYWRYEWIKQLQDGEEATPIKGETGYFVTNYGRVWGEWQQQWMSTTPAKTRNRPTCYYNRVHLKNKGIVNLHQLVGWHFLPWDGVLLVLHKDETLPKHMIDRVDNLYLGTQSDNVRDCVDKGRWSNGAKRPVL